MKKHLLLFFLVLIFKSSIIAQDTLQIDTIKTLKEIIVTYQADKITPITFQNIDSKELKIKSTGPRTFIFT